MTAMIGAPVTVRYPDGRSVRGEVVGEAPDSFAVEWPERVGGAWFRKLPLQDGSFKRHGEPEDQAVRCLFEEMKE